jgi:hypothetical protein
MHLNRVAFKQLDSLTFDNFDTLFLGEGWCKDVSCDPAIDWVRVLVSVDA